MFKRRAKKPVQRLTYRWQLVNIVTEERSRMQGPIGYNAQKMVDDFHRPGQPINIQLIEIQSGYEANQRVLREHILGEAEIHQFEQLSMPYWNDLCRRLTDAPLLRWVAMTTQANGYMLLQLQERMLAEDVNDPQRIVVHTLDYCLIDPEAAQSTEQSAEFIAAAQMSIDEYEQQRLSKPDVTKAEATQRKVQEADRLRIILEQSIDTMRNS